MIGSYHIFGFGMWLHYTDIMNSILKVGVDLVI